PRSPPARSGPARLRERPHPSAQPVRWQPAASGRDGGIEPRSGARGPPALTRRVARDVVVVIPAGGLGTRLGSRTPKQFVRLGPTAILAATVRHFAGRRDVVGVVVAAPAAHLTRARRVLASLAARVSVSVVEGGATRQESVARGLEAAPP